MDTTIQKINTIAEEIGKLLAGAASLDDDRGEAQKVFTKAAQAATAAREDALVSFATVAATAKWETSEIEGGINKALERRNDAPQSLKTFASELMLAAHPRVRAYVPQLQRIVAEAWDAELVAKAAAKAAPGKKVPADAPLAKAFQRRYHTLRTVIKAAKDGKGVISSPDELVAFARSRDPDLDAEKVAARLKAIRQSLRDFYADFPVSGINDCLEFLDGVGKAELSAARKAKLAGEDPREHDEPEHDEPENSENGESEPVEGAVDLDAMLDEATS